MKFIFIIFLILINAVPAQAFSRGEKAISIGDSTNYWSGSFGSYLAPFNAGPLQPGIDYVDNAQIFPSSFPNGVTISWTWPPPIPQPCTNAICGFMSVQWGTAQGAIPPVNITPKQVKNIVTLLQNFNLTFSGTVADYDVITDIWLSSIANGDPSTNVNEIEFFLHPNPQAISYINGSTQIGTFIDNQGHSWQVAHDGTDMLFMLSAHTDFASGSLNIGASLAYLVLQGQLTGNEWFNGLQTGGEPFGGSGSMRINYLAYAYS